MAVLDTFFILFKSDASDVEKGTKKAQESVDGLEGGLKGADKASIQLGKKFNLLATSALAAFASVAAVTAAISSARGISEQSSELGVLSDILGESASEIVNWGRAVQNMGGDSKAFEGSMRSLSGSLNDALINGPNGATDALAKMGISARDANGNMKTVLDILPELAGEFSGLTRESALARGKSLGLDEGTILLLMEGEQAVNALVARQRSMNGVSDEQIENLRRLKARWDEFRNAISDAGTVVLSALLPKFVALGAGIRAFTDLIAGDQGVAVRFFESIGNAAERWQFVADAIELVKAALAEAIELFDRVSSTVSSLFEHVPIMDFFDNAAGAAGGFFDMLDEGYKKITGAEIKAVQENMTIMSATPITALGAQNSAAGATSSSSNSASVSVGEITIETQATDSKAIAATLTAELESQLSNAVDQNDDGIAA